MTVKQEVSGVIATFADRRHADYFVSELKRAGFTEDEIGVLASHHQAEDTDGEAVTGAITGGMVGAVAGAVATGLIPGIGPVLATGLLAGILGGATTGGLLGALVGLGIHEEKARHHEQQVLEGHTLVVVQAIGRGGEALAILRRCEKTFDRGMPPTVKAGQR